jgi:transcriptional regulator with XRE-family HTH domain
MSELHTKLGELLQLERERQKVSLEDVSAELKIPESTLLQIEAGDLEALPAELYFKLFAKSYAEYLGIDYAKTVEAIREEIGEEIEPVEESAATQPPSAKTARKVRKAEPEKTRMPGDADLRSVLRKGGILGGVIVGAFVILIAVYQLFIKADAGQDADSQQPTATAGVDDQSTDEAANTLAAGYDWNVPEYEPPDSIRIAFKAREQSWATVVADGDTALYRNLVPGRNYEIAAQYRLVVSVGVPRLVDVSLDGRPADLSSATGRISRVEIDQTNRNLFGVDREDPTPAAQPPAPNQTGDVVGDGGQDESL